MPKKPTKKKSPKKDVNITEKLRKNIQSIAQESLAGKSLDKIARKYGCTRFLVIRVMRQELPEDFWIERMRRRARIGKVKATA